MAVSSSIVNPFMQALLLAVLVHVFMLAIVVASVHENSPEAKALVASSWWGENFTNNTSISHCNWTGITCNKAGNVIEINFYGHQPYPVLGRKLGSLNFCSLPKLKRLYLGSCGFEGSIPEQIGSLSHLTHLSLFSNQLTGTLPVSLTNLTQLEYLDVYLNNINGTLPYELGNLKNLYHLDLGGNDITGRIPSSVGSLTNLTYLYLDSNSLTGELPASLTNLSQLVYLSVSYNNVTGILPSELSNLKNLTHLGLSHNYFTGPIPSSLGSLTNLLNLYLDTNQLTSFIPPQLSNLSKLQEFDLGDNNLDGPIPLALCHLRNLEFLNLGMNRLNGSIPVQIANLTNLVSLDLNHNDLVGPIPHELGRLPKLDHLDFSSNKLQRELVSFKNSSYLVYINLSDNQMTGSLLMKLDGCNSLEYVDLSSNKLVGPIPPSFTNFLKLGYLNLSHNRLNGSIPSCLCPVCLPRSKVDLSENTLLVGTSTCALVSEVVPKPPLRTWPGKQFEHQKVEKQLLYLKIFLPVFALCFLVLGLVLFRRLKTDGNKSCANTEKHGDVCSIWNYDGKIAYEDFVKATDDFDIKYCIGTGGYGSVYEAKLPSGKTFALKKLHRFEAEEPTFDKSFKNEVQVLTNLRHKNIVKLYGFCLHNKNMFLVYEYMERGSLFCALRDEERAAEVDWIKRVNIIKGVAHALSYMHHDCTPSIVHRDISSNNILLNSEMEAFVADFGAARLLDPDSSNQTVIAYL